MKKLLAVFLILAMALPMCLIAKADTAQEKPFYFVNISSAPENLTNVYGMTFGYTSSNMTKDEDVWCSIVSLGKTNGLSDTVQKLKAAYDQQPEGTRYINFNLPSVAFHVHAEDVIYVDKAVQLTYDWVEEFFSAYHAIGGKIDGLVIDIEFENLYATYIHSRFAINDPLVYNKIVKNPLYATKIRPELEKRGFKFYSNVTELTPEIYSIHPNAGDAYEQSPAIWDTVVRNYINQSVTEACAPFLKYYPDGIVTDYQSKNTLSWLKELNDFGDVIGSGGNGVKAGNSNCENTYSIRLGESFYTDYYTKDPAYNVVPGYNRAVMDESPFVMFQHDSNIFKNTYLASDNGNISFWIAHHLYNTESKNSVSQTPYYTETLIHMALLNPQVLMGYIVPTELPSEKDYETAMTIVDDTMKELTRIVGYADRKPLDVATDWNSKFILSGMYASGNNYYRITPDTNVVSLEDFLVDATDPTFRVNGETVAFPGGEVIADNPITEVGSCGYWVKTAADVKPVITRDADYWREYPSYGENFDSYELGAEYNYKSALPAACWEIKKGKDSTAFIQSDPANASNKVLALTGTCNLKNVKLPENVTAGDSYAEHQAWEITVQLPDDLGDGEIVLLNAGNDKKQSSDGGIKIVGNQLYYDNAGEYLEMKGLTLEANTAYTIVREMDFSKETFLSSYRVYNAEEKLLAEATDIPMAAIEIPVLNISLSCNDISGGAVLLDNYKLYPTQVGYDFELYNAETGMQFTDTTVKTDVDTAYRFSWLNSTQEEKHYSIVAAYYDGDKLVEEKIIEDVTLAPNEDGIAYGIAEKAEGQTLMVYLKDNNTTNTNRNLLPILLICAGVALAIIVTASIFLLRKKKKA